MNAKVRKQLEVIKDAIDSAKSEVEDIASEEQSKFDNMPEGLQCSDRGDSMQTAIEALESAAGSLEEAIDSIDEAIGA